MTGHKPEVVLSCANRLAIGWHENAYLIKTEPTSESSA